MASRVVSSQANDFPCAACDPPEFCSPKIAFSDYGTSRENDDGSPLSDPVPSADAKAELVSEFGVGLSFLIGFMAASAVAVGGCLVIFFIALVQYVQWRAIKRSEMKPILGEGKFESYETPSKPGKTVL